MCGLCGFLNYGKEKIDFHELTNALTETATESVRGSFSFSILDSNNNLHLIKGDSPLCIIHMKKKKLYVYASTETILWKGLIETELFTELKAGNYEEIPLKTGEIMTITKDGGIIKSGFDYTEQDIELLQDEGCSYDEIEDILYAGYEEVFR